MKNSMDLFKSICGFSFKKWQIILLFLIVLIPSKSFAEQTVPCSPPYKPDNIFTVIFSYSDGMEYISSSEEACSDVFAKELIETFRSSIWVSKGCFDVTVEDLKVAKLKRRNIFPLLIKETEN